MVTLENFEGVPFLVQNFVKTVGVNSSLHLTPCHLAELDRIVNYIWLGWSELNINQPELVRLGRIMITYGWAGQNIHHIWWASQN